jgi:hypothetical protein
MGAAYARRISKVAAHGSNLLAMGATWCYDEILSAAHWRWRRIRGSPTSKGRRPRAGANASTTCEGMVGSVAAGLIKLTSALVDVAGGRRAAAGQRVGMRLFAEGIERVQALTDFGQYGGAPILASTTSSSSGAGLAALVQRHQTGRRAVRDSVPAGIATALGAGVSVTPWRVSAWPARAAALPLGSRQDLFAERLTLRQLWRTAWSAARTRSPCPACPSW